MDPVRISMSWPEVMLAYLPVMITLVAAVKGWMEARRSVLESVKTTEKVEVIDKAVKNVELQGNSMLMAHLKNTARLLKLLADDHPDNAALQSEYKAALHDIDVHTLNQAVIDDRKNQATP